ncbi:septal ring lytic transglycosylase RlpA family protein [Atopomonas sediminilitoris]|uniref:septal ring lytic transglycosylase RlpA family protein n=1 Tax=Atopomonas sediminilitoris TaxID=2919919 RepID=UPI001F4E4EB3|nr:septal ring lytic transglycosylase RlpA family protein [Atopomonas sediminilitoris]MCJ8170621.1 septal ring lytic transglycosylase RlpA family protein [Atopomonas sediminilitoris]
MPKLHPLAQWLVLGASAALLASCGGKQQQTPTEYSAGPISGPGAFSRPHRDGAPWWDVDVSQIQDAVPTPHNGAYKNSPYTVMGQRYFPLTSSRNYKVQGTGSWYGTKFHGQATANGETYDLYGMTAAHKTLPLPSYVRVTNLENQRSVIVRVNDRGPFYSDRVIDLSFAAAKKLGYAEKGVAPVSVEAIDPQQWWAERGQSAPLVLALPPKAEGTSSVAESYAPPPAAPVAVSQAPDDAKKKPTALPAGLYLQVGAFANPDAAELLRAKLSQQLNTSVSVQASETALHRVRIGPLASREEAVRLQDELRMANLDAGHVVTQQ